MLFMTKILLVRKKIKQTVFLGRICCDYELKDIRGGMGSSTRGTVGSQGRERRRRLFCVSYQICHPPESSSPHHIPAGCELSLGACAL